MPAGRPSTYDPAYCDRVMELADAGVGKREMAATLGCAWSTFQRWQDEHPEFQAAVKDAVHLSQAWWEKQGRVATFGGIDGFNATCFIFNMKNRFPGDWRDKHDHTLAGADGGPVQNNLVVTFVKSGKQE